MKIIAIDPGGNTGLVNTYTEFDIESAHVIVRDALLSGEASVHNFDCRDVIKGFAELDKLVCAFNPDVVVYETFDLWTLAADVTPIELIALMKWQWRYEEWSLAAQNPSERSVITDKRLKDWKLWTPGEKDINAAMKHLLVWMRKNQS